MGIRVLCADDHEIVRYGLCLLLDGQQDIDIVGQAANAPETLALLEKLRPDVLLLDLYVPGAAGLGLLEQVRRLHPEVPVVMMSGQATEARVREAMQAGAMAFVNKEEDAEELVRAIRAAVAGEKHLSPMLAQHAYAAYVDGVPSAEERKLDQLTEREAEIIRLAATGRTSADIARQLFISRRTVETHRSRAMQKLGLHNEVELARFFLNLESDDR
ncbi:response regulator transcription factor [bacterium]|nr:response regulator transcription factor [bacterium]